MVFKNIILYHNSLKAMIYLPKSANYHPTRTIHSGSHPIYTKNIQNQMDTIFEYGNNSDWKQEDYKRSGTELIKNERTELRSGKTVLNKNSVRKVRC